MSLGLLGVDHEQVEVGGCGNRGGVRVVAYPQHGASNILRVDRLEREPQVGVVGGISRRWSPCALMPVIGSVSLQLWAATARDVRHEADEGALADVLVVERAGVDVSVVDDVGGDIALVDREGGDSELVTAPEAIDRGCRCGRRRS